MHFNAEMLIFLDTVLSFNITNRIIFAHTNKKKKQVVSFFNVQGIVTVRSGWSGSEITIYFYL